MMEIGIAQAQTQFTKLLNHTVLIVDKKSHRKKAVILPYEEYTRLVSKTQPEAHHPSKGVFSHFVGALDSEFHTDDPKYNEIVHT
jgi:hypothetical protein